MAQEWLVSNLMPTEAAVGRGPPIAEAWYSTTPICGDGDARFLRLPLWNCVFGCFAFSAERVSPYPPSAPAGCGLLANHRNRCGPPIAVLQTYLTSSQNALGLSWFDASARRLRLSGSPQRNMCADLRTAASSKLCPKRQDVFFALLSHHLGPEGPVLASKIKEKSGV